MEDALSISLLKRTIGTLERNSMDTAIETTEVNESSLDNTTRALDYVDGHPNIGFILGWLMIGGGIGAVITYGRKVFNA